MSILFYKKVAFMELLWFIVGAGLTQSHAWYVSWFLVIRVFRQSSGMGKEGRTW